MGHAPDVSVMTPVIQFGFAGLSLILIAIIVWLIRQLLTLLGETNKIIAANTAAISGIAVQVADELRLLRTTHDLLLARPCIARLIVEQERDS